MKIGLKIPISEKWLRKVFTINRLPGQEIDKSGWLSRAGAGVSEETVLNNVTVWACVRLLSETLASLPLIIYKRLEPHGKERAFEHPLYDILHNVPNSEMTSFILRETMMAHLLTWGNAFALIEWAEDLTTVEAIWPLRPDRVWVIRDVQTKKIVYRYRPLNGTTIDIPSYRMWHIPGLGFDGLVGYSPITLAREAIGLALATEEFGARFFGQGTNIGAVAKHPGRLSPDAHQSLKKDLAEKYEGLGKSHMLMLLEEGMTFEKTTIPPEDAQFLQTRQFQRGEIASFFHVPPHMIGDLERATFSNIEQQSLEYVVYTVRPWLVRWEQSIHAKLLTPLERPTYLAEFLVDGLLRGDFESRTRGYWQAIQGGWLSPNEVRELENKNPREGGDDYLQPVNMIVSGQPPPLAKPI